MLVAIIITMYKVGESFGCGNCTNLITLEGASSEVRRSFRCSGSYTLASFEGAPSEVGGGFYCADCYKLSLNDDIPESIRDKIRNYISKKISAIYNIKRYT